MRILVTAIAAVLLLASCAEEHEAAAPAPDPDGGRDIVAADCSGCHGLDGRGKTGEIPNLAAQPVEYLVGAMHAYREGQRRHAALQEMIAGFSEADIRNIAAYFSGLPALPPDADGSGGEEAYREGEEIAAACTACHGERGFSTEPGVPSLAGQQPVYLMVATQEYASGRRGQAGKQQMLEGLAEVDIEKMAMYFASQAPAPRTPPPFGDPAAGEPQSASCGGCHGARGISPDPMVPNLAGQEPTYLVNAIKAYRGNERSHEDMVADKSDEEIENIAAFYAVQTAGSVVGAGEAADEVIAKCQRCHGPTAGETAMAVPSLNGQKREYLFHVMQEYRDGRRGNSMMHKMSSGYSDQLLEEIAAHYASLPR